MRKFLLSILITATIFSCKTSETSNFNASELDNAVIYEVNIRQYSPEGSFNAFTKDIPNLKQ